VRRALGEPDRSLDGIDDVGSADAGGGTGEGVAAARTTGRGDEAGALQFLQHLADGWQPDPGRVGELAGSAQTRAVLGELRQDHGGVVCELADAQQDGNSSIQDHFSPVRVRSQALKVCHAGRAG
jgi:hypothetical protein